MEEVYLEILKKDMDVFKQKKIPLYIETKKQSENQTVLLANDKDFRKAFDIIKDIDRKKYSISFSKKEYNKLLRGKLTDIFLTKKTEEEKKEIILKRREYYQNRISVAEKELIDFEKNIFSQEILNKYVTLLKRNKKIEILIFKRYSFKITYDDIQNKYVYTFFLEHLNFLGKSEQVEEIGKVYSEDNYFLEEDLKNSKLKKKNENILRKILKEINYRFDKEYLNIRNKLEKNNKVLEPLNFGEIEQKLNIRLCGYPYLGENDDILTCDFYKNLYLKLKENKLEIVNSRGLYKKKVNYLSIKEDRINKILCCYVELKENKLEDVLKIEEDEYALYIYEKYIKNLKKRNLSTKEYINQFIITDPNGTISENDDVINANSIYRFKDLMRLAFSDFYKYSILFEVLEDNKIKFKFIKNTFDYNYKNIEEKVLYEIDLEKLSITQDEMIKINTSEKLSESNKKILNSIIFEWHIKDGNLKELVINQSQLQFKIINFKFYLDIFKSRIKDKNKIINFNKISGYFEKLNKNLLTKNFKLDEDNKYTEENLYMGVNTQEDEYDRKGFNYLGIHKDTNTLFNLQGYDKYGFDKKGIHKKTNNKWDLYGITQLEYQNISKKIIEYKEYQHNSRKVYKKMRYHYVRKHLRKIHENIYTEVTGHFRGE